jgi:large subunit ribosomal protein L29
MNTQETNGLRSLPGSELQSELNESLRALFNLRFQSATRQLADVSQVRRSRRRVARIKTLLREREILIELGQLDADESPVSTVDSPSDAVESVVESEGVVVEEVADESVLVAEIDSSYLGKDSDEIIEEIETSGEDEDRG